MKESRLNKRIYTQIIPAGTRKLRAFRKSLPRSLDLGELLNEQWGMKQGTVKQVTRIIGRLAREEEIAHIILAPTGDEVKPIYDWVETNGAEYSFHGVREVLRELSGVGIIASYEEEMFVETTQHNNRTGSINPHVHILLFGGSKQVGKAVGKLCKKIGERFPQGSAREVEVAENIRDQPYIMGNYLCKFPVTKVIQKGRDRFDARPNDKTLTILKNGKKSGDIRVRDMQDLFHVALAVRGLFSPSGRLIVLPEDLGSRLLKQEDIVKSIAERNQQNQISLLLPPASFRRYRPSPSV